MEFFNDITSGLENFDENAIWIIKIASVVFLALLADFIAGIFIRKIKTRAENTDNLWDDALVHAFRKPVRLLIWVIGLTFAAEIAFYEKYGDSFYLIQIIKDIVVIFALAWFCLRFITSIETAVFSESERKKHRLDKTTILALSKLLRLTVIITAILIAMQSLGFSVAGVLAAGGIGGLAIGFAAKDLLANFFGAIMIYFDRPFEVGDWIRSPDKEIEGTVAEIGWRLTKIYTFDKRPLYVPNSIFTTIAVENPSRMTHRRINEVIGVRYDDMKKVDKITADVKKMLKTHDDIDTAQTLMVNIDKFDSSSVNFFIYCFTKTTVWTEYHDIKQDVLLKIAGIIDKHGGQIAFPTRTIHTPELAGLKLKSK